MEYYLVSTTLHCYCLESENYRRHAIPYEFLNKKIYLYEQNTSLFGEYLAPHHEHSIFTCLPIGHVGLKACVPSI